MGSCVHSIRLIAMEVNSEDYRRGVRSLTGGSRINRQLWVRPRSSSFYQDTIQGWSDVEFKGNFCVSRPTFAYLVYKLKPTLERQDFLHSSIPADQRIAIILWRLGTNVEYRTISHLFGVDLSTVCVLVHQVCQAIVEGMTQHKSI